MIRQLKSFFDSEKKNYWDYDDEEYRGIKDLKRLFEEVNEDDEEYYKPERLRNPFRNDTGDYNYIVYESRGSKYYVSLEEYLIKIRPYLENMIRNFVSISEWKIQLIFDLFLLKIQNNFVLGIQIVKILKL